MEDSLKYYHGEIENPYNEINENQGLWCMRYNEVAAMLWDFEYHWVNGWEKYRQLKGRNIASYFETYKFPKESFVSIDDALKSFSWNIYSKPLYLGSERWVHYVYNNAMDERFYQPIFNIVPEEEVPQYLHWYKGEANNPFTHERSDSTKGFWWNFEYNWYKTTQILSEEGFYSYLHDYIANRLLHEEYGWERIPKEEQEMLMLAYRKGVTRWSL